jgi:hypothetical protein
MQNIRQCQYQPSLASCGDPVYDREMTTPPAHARAASPRRVPTLNPDGISVEGCTYIYAPIRSMRCSVRSECNIGLANRGQRAVCVEE